jgi:bifunctional DNA-binding transcriptional regulator/antitoxin component of YhaV-PrlF toxin-antitoxin module
MSETIEVLVDTEGGILLPAAISDRLGLTPGMRLVTEPGGAGGVRLRVEDDRPALAYEGKALVATGEILYDPGDVVRQERDGRVEELLRRCQ